MTELLPRSQKDPVDWNKRKYRKHVMSFSKFIQFEYINFFEANETNLWIR